MSRSSLMSHNSYVIIEFPNARSHLIRQLDHYISSWLYNDGFDTGGARPMYETNSVYRDYINKLLSTVISIVIISLQIDKTQDMAYKERYEEERVMARDQFKSLLQRYMIDHIEVDQFVSVLEINIIREMIHYVPHLDNTRIKIHHFYFLPNSDLVMILGIE